MVKAHHMTLSVVQMLWLSLRGLSFIKIALTVHRLLSVAKCDECHCCHFSEVIEKALKGWNQDQIISPS